MSDYNTYDVGDVVRITGTFTNAASGAVDPGTVYAKYKDPSGTVTTLTYLVDVALVRVSAGVYYTDVNADETGRWYYRFSSTGTGQAMEEGAFLVRQSNF